MIRTAVLVVYKNSIVNVKCGEIVKVKKEEEEEEVAIVGVDTHTQGRRIMFNGISSPFLPFCLKCVEFATEHENAQKQRRTSHQILWRGGQMNRSRHGIRENINLFEIRQ